MSEYRQMYEGRSGAVVVVAVILSWLALVVGGCAWVVWRMWP